jgi:hypothetical protein
MKVVNYMAHEVDACGNKYPPSGHVARVATTLRKVGDIDGIPLMVCDSGAVQNCPPKKDGVVYIVSQYVRQALPERSDLISPAKLHRDNNGKVVGCGAFEKNP